MNVTLRSRKISGGRLSWSADIQPPPIIDGKPKRFWTLDIYTVEKPKSQEERAQNSELMKRLEQKRSRLYLMSIDGLLPTKSAGKTVSQAMADIKNTYTKKGTQLCWEAAKKHCEAFGIGGVLLADLTPAQCVAFRTYLLGVGIKASSAGVFLSKFRAMLRQAKRAGVLKLDLRDSFDPIAAPEAEVGWLEADDRDRIFMTPTTSSCREPFIFACLVGLRYSDLAALDWTMITDSPDGTATIRYRVTKTKKMRTLPIGKEARSVLGSRGAGKVFPRIPRIESYNDALKRWALRAGVDMPTISSHIARHTWAVHALDSGIPLEIVREMLAHSSIKQTEVYAKVRDERVKQYAGVVKTSVDVSSFPLLRKVK